MRWRSGFLKNDQRRAVKHMRYVHRSGKARKDTADKESFITVVMCVEGGAMCDKEVQDMGSAAARHRQVQRTQ